MQKILKKVLTIQFYNYIIKVQTRGGNGNEINQEIRMHLR